ncbi:MAG: ParB/RepB/Spo0J family partition protein [Clostridia bacterium]|nr:ParB/RepB/Spo0J family partition protein [Clostridia bacterium]
MATIGLGRGLAALFSDTEEAYENAQNEGLKAESGVGVKSAKGGVTELSLDDLYPNPDQPRKAFDQNALSELSASIKEHGVIMPIIVNKEPDGRYMIIAGERRFRAAKMAGLTTVPTIVKEYTPRQIEEISLIENLQREDLNPIEAATAMKRLMEEYRLTQEDLAERIGKSRPAITNTLRLLSLPTEIVELVRTGKLSSGHARALITLPQDVQLQFARQAVKEGFSVRQMEKLVKDYINPPEITQRKKDEMAARASVEFKNLIERMRFNFKTKVSFIGSEKKGRIYIDYYSRDDLDRIFEILDIIERQE